MMINPDDAQVGFHVYYQAPHSNSPEYGVITSLDSAPSIIHVRFFMDTTSKACKPEDLNWPPYFCAFLTEHPKGQPFDHNWEQTNDQ